MTARILQKILFNLSIWVCGLVVVSFLIPWLIHTFSPAAKIEPLSFASFADFKLLIMQIGGAIIAMIYVFILNQMNPAAIPPVPPLGVGAAVAQPATPQQIFLGELQSTLINFGSLSLLIVIADKKISYLLSLCFCYFAAWILRSF